jgi:hypothetical protein
MAVGQGGNLQPTGIESLHPIDSTTTQSRITLSINGHQVFSLIKDIAK